MAGEQMKRLIIASAILLVAITANFFMWRFIWQTVHPKPACPTTINVPAHATLDDIDQIAKMARQWCLDNGYSVNK